MQTSHFFRKQTKQNNFFILLVSDRIVTLTCLSVTHELFAELIDLFLGLAPSLYADEVLCAASWAAIPPPIYYSGGAKHENDKTLYKCMKRISDATGPQS